MPAPALQFFVSHGSSVEQHLKEWDWETSSAEYFSSWLFSSLICFLMHFASSSAKTFCSHNGKNGAAWSGEACAEVGVAAGIMCQGMDEERPYLYQDGV